MNKLLVASNVVTLILLVGVITFFSFQDRDFVSPDMGDIPTPVVTQNPDQIPDIVVTPVELEEPNEGKAEDLSNVDFNLQNYIKNVEPKYCKKLKDDSNNNFEYPVIKPEDFVFVYESLPMVSYGRLMEDGKKYIWCEFIAELEKENPNSEYGPFSYLEFGNNSLPTIYIYDEFSRELGHGGPPFFGNMGSLLLNRDGVSIYIYNFMDDGPGYNSIDRTNLHFRAIKELKFKNGSTYISSDMEFTRVIEPELYEQLKQYGEIIKAEDFNVDGQIDQEVIQEHYGDIIGKYRYKYDLDSMKKADQLVVEFKKSRLTEEDNNKIDSLVEHLNNVNFVPENAK
ncbi:hypothetical protein KBD45_01225 [Candidatus Dojkabacteria bacterium]|nr:hypothetical protein [Candidatus Dojkabacteria bacterium]